MSVPVGYILDTNILLEVARGNARGRAIDQQYGLSSSLSNCMISVVTVGEMRSLALKFGWGKEKKEKLNEILDEIVWIDINRREVLEAYASIDHFSQRSGRSMGKNDVWIAATTSATGATLLTTDPDFDHLDGSHISRIKIDPRIGKGS